jgi:ABC-type multidrug transport system ATPase subunit
MLILDSIEKTYHQRKIINNFSLTADFNQIIGISGRNGSGKSTLLKMISGFITPSQGTIYFSNPENNSLLNDWYQKISFLAPYIDIYQDFKLEDALHFHFKVKKIQPDFEIKDLIALSELPTNKLLKDFSSGMLQKLKIIIALYTQSDILLIDEPTEFLDSYAKSWFYKALEQQKNKRIILIASNNEEDFSLCDFVETLS